MPESVGRRNSILFLDIETAPNLGYTWGKYEQSVIRFVREWIILCFAYKWRGSSSVRAIRVADPSDDRDVCEVLHKLLDQAEIVVAHNGKEFDIKRINARFLKHGITPPSPYAVVDTLKIARSKFKLNSNSLDDIGQYLGVGRKAPSSFALWEGAMRNDPKAFAKLVSYCRQDVRLLEAVYERLLPWADTHPNVLLPTEQVFGCPRCGQTGPLERQGHRYTRLYRIERWRCPRCGAWLSGEKHKRDDPIVLQ